MLAYNIGIFAYRFFAWLFAAFNSKAKAWYIGNTTQTSVLLEPKQKKRVWFHISSLGEYEQAKPVIKGLVNNFEIVITFFSPSGYQHKSVREFTEHVFYIGIDTKTQAKNNIKNIVPDLFVLVKYDFWLNHLFQLEKENVKSIIISGLFRPKQVFFKPWGGKFRMALETFDHLFLQNQTSSDLLQSIGIDNSTVNGDTRVDSVLDNVPVAMDRLPDSIKQFAKGNKCLVVGSSYLDEEQIIADNISGCLNDWKIII
ncbi:MAG: 3-deoxy-D-manno-octulosonic acid transferase, partial [Bacteroidia bacterium]